MRESIGATFLIKIMVVFIVLYNSLLAIAVNYAMVFRVKNRIIDLLEQYEGCRVAQPYIEDYIANVGYYKAGNAIKNPYDISPVIVSGRGTYYRVFTYITFHFPVVQDLLHFNVVGETKILYGKYDESQHDCDWPR